MSQGLRTDRVGDLIRCELSMMLIRDVHDPGVRHVTVTRVRMTKDLQQARVYYTALTDEGGIRDTARALRRARSFLKHRLAQRLRLRHVPELTFLYDDSVEQQVRVAGLFGKIASEHSEDPDDNEPNKS